MSGLPRANVALFIAGQRPDVAMRGLARLLLRRWGPRAPEYAEELASRTRDRAVAMRWLEVFAGEYERGNQ